MSNSLYNIGRQRLLKGQMNWESAGTIKAVLLDINAGAGYTFSAAHANMSSTNIPAACRIAEIALIGCSATSEGAANADDPTFPAVPVGSPLDAVLIYQYNGADDTLNYPIAYLDSMTGLPFTPNGGDIIVVWDNGTNKIFRP